MDKKPAHLTVDQQRDLFAKNGWSEHLDAPAHQAALMNGFKTGDVVTVCRVRGLVEENEFQDLVFVKPELTYPPLRSGSRDQICLQADESGTWQRCHTSGERYGIDEERPRLLAEGWIEGTPNPENPKIKLGDVFTVTRATSTDPDIGGSRPFFYKPGALPKLKGEERAIELREVSYPREGEPAATYRVFRDLEE